MEAFTENLIEEFIRFDNDCEIESDICSGEATWIQKIQRYESRGAFSSVMKQSYFEKTNHGFCPLCWLRVEIFKKLFVMFFFNSIWVYLFLGVERLLEHV